VKTDSINLKFTDAARKMILYARKALVLKQSEVAAALEIPVMSYSAYERGYLAIPFHLIMPLSEVLEIPFRELATARAEVISAELAGVPMSHLEFRPMVFQNICYLAKLNSIEMELSE